MQYKSGRNAGCRTRCAALGLLWLCATGSAAQTPRGAGGGDAASAPADERGDLKLKDLARVLLEEPPPREPAPAEADERAPGPPGTIALNDAGLFDVHFRDAEIAAILELLSY